MPKYIEITAPDDFDDDQHTIFDAIDAGAEIGLASRISRHDLEQALLELDGECQFDSTGTESTLGYVFLKRRCATLVAQIRKERKERLT